MISLASTATYNTIDNLNFFLAPAPFPPTKCAITFLLIAGVLEERDLFQTLRVPA
jgi:hypothetical protein